MVHTGLFFRYRKIEEFKDRYICYLAEFFRHPNNSFQCVLKIFEPLLIQKIFKN